MSTPSSLLTPQIVAMHFCSVSVVLWVKGRLGPAEGQRFKRQSEGLVLVEREATTKTAQEEAGSGGARCKRFRRNAGANDQSGGGRLERWRGSARAKYRHRNNIQQKRSSQPKEEKVVVEILCDTLWSGGKARLGQVPPPSQHVLESCKESWWPLTRLILVITEYTQLAEK